MKKSKIILSSIILLGFVFMGYQCGSSEINSARLYINQKNFDKAEESLQKEIQKNPKSDEAHYLLGYVYGEQKKIPEMVEAFNKSLAISDAFKEDIEKSKDFYYANSFNEGVKAYQSAISAQNEDSIKVYFDKAADHFESAIAVRPDSADSYRNLAFVYMNQNDIDNAVPPLRKLLEKEKSADSYKFLGQILYEKGRQLMTTDSAASVQTFNEAIKVLQEGQKLNPEDADILTALSNSYIGANRLDEAMSTFKAGTESDPGNPFYHYNYGVLLLGANQFAEAEQEFLKALEIDPEYQNALYNLGVTYVKWGTKLNEEAEAQGKYESGYKEKYQQALPHLEKVVQLNDEDLNTWELLGKVYGVLGMTEDATNAFNKADELRSK